MKPRHYFKLRRGRNKLEAEGWGLACMVLFAGLAGGSLVWPLLGLISRLIAP